MPSTLIPTNISSLELPRVYGLGIGIITFNLINLKPFFRSFLVRFPRSRVYLTNNTKIYKITIYLFYLVCQSIIYIKIIKPKSNLSLSFKAAIYNLGIKLIINPNNLKL